MWIYIQKGYQSKKERGGEGRREGRREERREEKKEKKRKKEGCTD